MNIINKVFGKIIIPLAYYLRGDKRFKYYNYYKQHLKKDTEYIQKFQQQRLQKLIKHAYETTTYYKELFDIKGLKPQDIKTIKDIKLIPPLNKETVLDREKDLISNKPYKLIRHYSGGSTGNSSVIHKDKRFHEISRAILLRDIYSLGIEPGEKSAWIWGHEELHKSKMVQLSEALLNKINRRIKFNVFRYTDDDIEYWITQKLNKFKPNYMFGYAGVIYDMAKCIQKRNLSVTHLKKIITTSERLEHREFIEDVFRCKVIDMYGCTEVNAIAIEDENHIMHISDDVVILEVDEDYQILLTALESYGMPLIRYKLGDIGLVKKQKKKIGTSPFSQFKLTVGRTYEILINNKGEKISGGLIKQYIEEDNIQVREFQLIQHTIKDVELKIVKDKRTTQEGIIQLCKIIKTVLGCKEVKITQVETFPVERNGKRIAFKCEVKP